MELRLRGRSNKGANTMAMATTSVEANKAAIRRLYDETNKGNYDFLDELLAPDFTSYGGAGFKDLHGPAEFKELTMTFLTSFPDLWFQVDELIAEGDDVLVSGTLSGTHKGDFYGMAPTGNKVSWTGCAIFRFRGPQVIARWQEFDALGLMAQIQPPAEGAAAPAAAPAVPAAKPADPTGGATSIEENKAIFHRIIDELWNQKKIDVADELFAADHESPSAPGLPPGPAGTKMIASMFLAAFPDLHVDIEIEIAEGDTVGGRLRQKGTHTGPMVSPTGTIAPTGKAVDFTEVAMLRIVDGKVATSWYWTDMIGLLTQIGVIAAPPSARG
jgi:predicted ester cyclase